MRVGPWITAGAALALVGWLTAGSCGHVVPAAFAPNHAGADLDLRRLAVECPQGLAPRPAAEAGDGVVVRYLGAGGLYLEWRGKAVLTAPFFSDYSAWQVQFGLLAPDERRIARGLQGLDLAKVSSILVGHSHYDHLGDLPWIVERHFLDRGIPAPTVLVNRSGALALAAYPDLPVQVYERRNGPWITLAEESGRPLIRAWPLPSRHAPHFDHVLLYAGELTAPWRDGFETHHPSELLEGGTTNFLIDFLDERGAVAYRMFFQDAASGRGETELPAAGAIDPHPIDLAVLCMASYAFVDDAPGWLVGELRPRHVLVAHWEDFFRGQERAPRFVAFLSDRAVAEYFGRLRAALAALPAAPGDRSAAMPRNAARLCGATAPGWTLPLPGEWLEFATIRP
ncbi:MAG: MBL fold metallo-hydrolase [Acidobacteriota bacterium]